jgi:hypothetical protein
MNLIYKEDWDETKERYNAWWAGENFGRCGMWVTAPRDEVPDEPVPPRPETPEERWTDLDYISALNEHTHRRTFYGGEAFPVWQAGYPGHKSLAAFLGCRITLDFDTGWIDPIWTGDDMDCQSLALDDHNPYFQYTIAEQVRSVEEAKGKSIPVISGAFGGCGDTLAWIRGSERLLYDVMDRPDQVREADQYLMDLWIQVYDRFHNLTREVTGGSTTWFPLWSSGKMYSTQNDFAYMISPKQFQHIFLPTIEKQLQYLDHSIHHLDGEGNFAHLDALCELPDLNAIQVLPGAGKPSPLHYMPILKRVQASRKNLHIMIPSGEVEMALSELSARGLFIHTSCESEQEARSLLSNAEKWSHDRLVGTSVV